jgi:hypothetical protein
MSIINAPLQLDLWNTAASYTIYIRARSKWNVLYILAVDYTTLTYSMEQSPWETNRFSASQEIPRILGIQKTELYDANVKSMWK